MKRSLILGGFLLGAAFIALGASFIAPVAMSAADQHDKRLYDREGRDYHVYNTQEDRSYRIYLEEQHVDYREFGHLDPAQQRQYFEWRREHPDQILFKDESSRRSAFGPPNEMRSLGRRAGRAEKPSVGNAPVPSR
jgi:hypothetical protein